MNNAPKMYIFVRGDLSIPQQIIQSAHAVDELNKVYPHRSQNHIVLCDAENEQSLFGVSDFLTHHGIKHRMFYETDISSHTAIATVPLCGKECQPLKRLGKSILKQK